jgi:pimeloyl-ACP methyl ester carboxylesterase
METNRTNQKKPIQMYQMPVSLSQLYQGVLLEQVERLLAFRAEHPLTQLEIDGTQWEYITCGQGEHTLLVLNGGLRIAESAFKYIHLFEQTYRLIVPTYPPLWDIDELTDGIVTILEHEGVNQPFILGQSYGGMVAQALVQRHPARVRKMVLSSAGPVLANTAQERILAFSLAVIPRLPQGWVLRIWRRALSSVLSPPPAEQRFWNAYLQELSTYHLTKADLLSHFRSGEDALKKYAFDRPDIIPWSGDVLIIGGEGDPVSTSADREKLASFYPNSYIHVIKEAGHSVAFQEPDMYLQAVNGFFTMKV